MTTTDHRLDPPSGDKLPLMLNVYEFGRMANARLTPMFPYRDPGSIVVGITLIHGDDGSFERFHHLNTQEEVGIALGGGGSMGKKHPNQAPGAVFVAGKAHEVFSPLENGQLPPEEVADPDSFSFAVICQRQSEEGEQHEKVAFRCLECNHKLFEFAYESTPGKALDVDGVEDEVIELDATLWGSFEAGRRFNAEVAGTPCPKCGTPAPRFPLEKWGWDEFMINHRAVNRGLKDLRSAGSAFLSQKGVA